MEIKISKRYLTFLFLLWISPVVSAVWGGPIWLTVSMMSLFAIYAGHEWAHAWICQINNLEVIEVNLASGGKTHILFEEAEGPQKDKIESDVYLAGVAYDSIFWTIAALSCMMYAMVTKDPFPMFIGACLIILLIFNLATPGSDWQEFMSRVHKRV